MGNYTYYSTVSRKTSAHGFISCVGKEIVVTNLGDNSPRGPKFENSLAGRDCQPAKPI